MGNADLHGAARVIDKSLVYFLHQKSCIGKSKHEAKEDGVVVGVWLIEKGGKVRLAPVLNEYRGAVTEIVDRLTRERGSSTRGVRGEAPASA